MGARRIKEFVDIVAICGGLGDNRPGFSVLLSVSVGMAPECGRAVQSGRDLSGAKLPGQRPHVESLEKSALVTVYPW